MSRVVATILIAVLLSCCRSHEGEAAFWRNEREKTELTQRLQLAEYRLSHLNARNPGELERLRIMISEMEVRLWALRSDQSALTADIAAIEDRNTEMSGAALAKQREKAMGMAFDALTAKNGRVYQNAKVVKVDDTGVWIRHEDGAARLRYADLSNEQRLFFGMEESSALAAEERERKEALLYEQSIDRQMAVIREKEAADSERNAENEEARSQRSRIAAASIPREPSLLSQPARPFGSGSIYRRGSGYYSSGYYSSGNYRTAYRYVYAYPTAPNPFCAVRTSHAHGTHSATFPSFQPSRSCATPFQRGSAPQMPTTP